MMGNNVLYNCRNCVEVMCVFVWLKYEMIFCYWKLLGSICFRVVMRIEGLCGGVWLMVVYRSVVDICFLDSWMLEGWFWR